MESTRIQPADAGIDKFQRDPERDVEWMEMRVGFVHVESLMMDCVSKNEASSGSRRCIDESVPVDELETGGGVREP